ncbi:reverse transcriptase domain-containing protein [Tanacetum coccineum]
MLYYPVRSNTPRTMDLIHGMDRQGALKARMGVRNLEAIVTPFSSQPCVGFTSRQVPEVTTKKRMLSMIAFHKLRHYQSRVGRYLENTNPSRRWSITVDRRLRLCAPARFHAEFMQYALRTSICSREPYGLVPLLVLPGEIISETMGNNSVITRSKTGEGIKARLDRHKGRWVEELSHVLWAHRTTIKVSTGDTPFSLVYGTEAVIPAEIGMPTIRTAEVNIATNDDERRIDLDIWRKGDFVYRANDASHAEDTGKLGPKWEGPYEVTEALGKGAYKLRDMDGRKLGPKWEGPYEVTEALGKGSILRCVTWYGRELPARGISDISRIAIFRGSAHWGGKGCRGDDNNGGGWAMVVLAAVGQQPERRGEGKSASGGE